MPAAVAAPVARHGRNFRGPARRTVGLPPWTNSALLAGASARPDLHALVGLVGGPVRAAPAEPTANRRLRRCGRARLPCGRPPCVLCMQTRATSRAHVVNRASHRRHAPLRRRPCLLVPKRVLQAPKDEGDTRPPDELAGPRMQCTSRWVSRQRAARARPQRGRGTAPRGQDLAAHAGEAGVVGRDRGVRGLCSTPGCACSTDCLCLAVWGSCGAVAAADTTPQVLPSIPTTHSALPGARARTAPAGPHAPPTHARAHTPHGQPGRPPRPPPSPPPSAKRRAARPRRQRAPGGHARTHPRGRGCCPPRLRREGGACSSGRAGGHWGWQWP